MGTRRSLEVGRQVAIEPLRHLGSTNSWSDSGWCIQNGGVVSDGVLDPEARRRLAVVGMTESSTGFSLCGGCAQQDRCLLGVTSEHLAPDGSATFDVECPAEREGSSGVAHGGWIADVFDETLGRGFTLAGVFAVTKALNVRFLRPVPITTPLVVSVAPFMRDGEQIVVRGELLLAGGDTVHAIGDGTFVVRDREAHLQRFQSWLGEGAS